VAAKHRAAALQKSRVKVERAADELTEAECGLDAIDREAHALRKVAQAIAELKDAWMSLEAPAVKQQEELHRAIADLDAANAAHRKAAAGLEETRARTG
jgi:hypothetical protein